MVFFGMTVIGIKACLDFSGDAGHLHRASNVPRTLHQPLLLTCTEPQRQRCCKQHKCREEMRRAQRVEHL